jgi:preprotein translocase subunit SecE
MARDRQRSKQRQQQRREERLAQRRESAALGGRPEEALEPDPVEPDPADDLLELADLEVGAPPQDIGRSDRTVREEPPAPSFETDDEELGDWGDDDDGSGGRGGGGSGGRGGDDSTGAGGPRGRRGEPERADGRRRGRLVAFLVAVWAELQRVQWPDRRQLTQLTGVVLFFVLIVGAYLGGLDAIFSKLIQAIL